LISRSSEHEDRKHPKNSSTICVNIDVIVNISKSARSIVTESEQSSECSINLTDYESRLTLTPKHNYLDCTMINSLSKLSTAFLLAVSIGAIVSAIPSATVAAPFPGDRPVPDDSLVDSSRRLKNYVLFGTDGNSNAYTGDTSTSEAHGLLCLAKVNLPKPAGLPAPVTTPGGALRDSWSGGYIMVVPNVPGQKLTSKAVADGICNSYGQQNYGVAGFKMAEFHDGDKQAGWAGWSFWGDASLAARRGFEGFNDRVWTSISDQNANPWGVYNQTGNGQVRKALTFVKTNQIRLRG
jgi:hypothetical protein